MRIFMLASSPSTLVNFRGCLIEALLGMDHEVHVAAPDITEDMVTCKWLNQRGVVIHNVPMSRTGLNVFADLETFFGFYRLMRTTKPNLVFAYTVKPVVWGVIAAWLAKVPKRVALITGLGYAFIGEAKGKRALVRWIVSALYGLALRAATLVIFQNPDDRNDFRRWGILPSKRASVLVNGSGVDTAAFPLSPLPEMPPKFLLVARLLKDKGVREYVHAATIVRQTYPNATFDIVGPIDSNPEGLSQAVIDGWQEAGDITWHGALADVRPAIAAASVFVLPSYREGMPRSVLEAMSMGRPIITTDAPGCRETVEHGTNGLLVPVRNAEALATAMQKFLDDPELVIQMGVQSRRIAVEKYDVGQVNRQMMLAMQL